MTPVWIVVGAIALLLAWQVLANWPKKEK